MPNFTFLRFFASSLVHKTYCFAEQRN